MDAFQNLPDFDKGESSEVQKLIFAFCAHFGIDEHGQTEHLMALAAPCQGWPQHLHFALQAMGREALRTDGDLSAVDWPEIMREAAQARWEYYQMQQAGTLEKAPVLTANVMARISDGIRHHHLKALIDAHIHGRLGEHLPDSLDREGFLQRLVHRGALHRRKDGAYHSPIPSFRAFLIQAGGLQPDIHR